MKPIIRIKRIYEQPAITDGHRILVDRLWPRGLKKEGAGIDDWEKELAPSTELRKWFGHDPKLWTEFKKKYKAELKANPETKFFTEKYKNKKSVTLLYAAKDEEHNQAVVLSEYLTKL